METAPSPGALLLLLLLQNHQLLLLLLLLQHLLLQLRPALAEAVLARTKLLKWLLSRIKVKGSDSNKQYASEVLSILMQVSHLQAV